MKKQINVAAAVIIENGKYLCMQRTRSHYPYISEHWEFPGGKVEEGECHHETLLREIKEEMDWDVYVGRKLGTVHHEYPDFEITLTAYLCKGGDGEPKLLEHLDSKWLDKKEMAALNWTEADKALLELL
ncbi:MAG: (deoxy)nucleoside triphosphate pyrophosphohydrolase [Prevotella sp.]|nr:(deoxy)nucleoside triphosphate pyrophosphohydrolase [Prevotella sp.]